MAGATGTRKLILDVTVYTIGGTSFLGHMVSAELKIDTATIENRAAMDTDAYPRATVQSWSFTGELVADTTGVTYPTNLQTPVFNRTPVQLVWTTGAGTYTGNGIMTSFGHRAQDGQTMNVEITGQGPIVIT
jgi:hypothetical protein